MIMHLASEASIRARVSTLIREGLYGKWFFLLVIASTFIVTSANVP
jgi:hypothetical protein